MSETERVILKLVENHIALISLAVSIGHQPCPFNFTFSEMDRGEVVIYKIQITQTILGDIFHALVVKSLRAEL